MTNTLAASATEQPNATALLSSITVSLGDLSEAQDAALFEIVALAKLATAALATEAEDAADNAVAALAVIARTAGAAIHRQDEAAEGMRDAIRLAA